MSFFTFLIVLEEKSPGMLRAKNVCLFTTFVRSNAVLYKVDNIRGKNRIVEKLVRKKSRVTSGQRKTLSKQKEETLVGLH